MNNLNINQTNTQPHIPPIDVDRVPDYLKALKVWAPWRLELGKSGRWGKVPIKPVDDGYGPYASANNPRHRWSFDQCLRIVEGGAAHGLGIMTGLNETDERLVAIDLDDAFDAAGDLKRWAWDIVKRLNSYTELSPGGRGLHIVITCAADLDLPNRDHDLGDGKIQLFIQNHYCTITGNTRSRLPLQAGKVWDRTAELQALFDELWPAPTPTVNVPTNSSGQSQWWSDDQHFWDTVFAGNGGNDARDYYEGKLLIGDHSRDDLRLCGMLAFYTGGDASAIDYFFRQTGLYRDKWDRDDYRNGTITKAINNCMSFYTPRQQWDPAAIAAAQAAVGTNGMNGHQNGAQAPQTNTAGANGSASAPTIRNTDAGNARRLVRHFGQDIHYVTEWGKWLIWDGKRWAKDETRQIEAMAKLVVAGIFQEAVTLSGADRDELWKWGIRSEDQTRIVAMVRSAQSEPGISVDHKEFDKDPWLLNVRNGILDLRTGNLRPHDRGAMITKLIDIDYDPQATCPLWEAFLDRVQGGNQEVIDFLRRAVGYSLTGSVKEQSLFFLHGGGSNGKSTFTETITALLGDYVCRFKSESLMRKAIGEGIPNDVARLPGMRLVVSSEVEQGRHLAEAKIKELTGGDTISARFMRQEFFDFEPTHKLWMFGNHKPVITGSDKGIWRRVKLIPFTVQIPEDQQDQDLPEKLRGELPGILAWAVRGCLEWQENGLKAPQAVTAATAKYKDDMDRLKPFIDQECVTGTDPRTGQPYRVLYRQLYGAYTAWCQQNGEKALNARTFREMLDERGFTNTRGAANAAMREGITLRSIAAAQAAVNP